MNDQITFAAGNFGSPLQMIILLVIVLLLFGGNRLRNLGGDIGGAIKGFKNAMSDGDKDKEKDAEKLTADSHKVIEGSLEKDKVTADKDTHK